ncbi:MAG: ABC transporter ATP-binding protein [Burkholderiales bacterium]|nr:ABC transporter ATP-binding protein [Burkholderiales bacterium]
MPEPLLRLDSVSRRFGGLQALDGVSFEVGRGEVLGLIGPNGAGKTTLVNVICGVHRASAGRVLFEGRDITALKPFRTARSGLARTFQIVQPFPELTVTDNVAAAASFSRGLGVREARLAALEQLEFVGLAEHGQRPAATLTLAMRKRLELAKALAMQPRLLFLDEVNAGLNSAEVEQAMALIRRIAGSGVTIVLIEHLMKVVMSVCSRIVVLQQGALIAEGSPAEIVADARVVEAYLGKKYAQAAGSAAS